MCVDALQSVRGYGCCWPTPGQCPMSGSNCASRSCVNEGKDAGRARQDEVEQVIHAGFAEAIACRQRPGSSAINSSGS